MSKALNIQPALAPSAGTNSTPNLTALPAPKRPRSPSDLNRCQVRELNKAEQIGLAAQKPAYAPSLSARDIPAPFVTQLLADIAAARTKSNAAVQATSSTTTAVKGGVSARATLLKGLRVVQSSARQLHRHTDPERLQDYFVGERLVSSRAMLEQTSQGIIAKADQERPPGVDTNFITRLQGDRTAYVQSAVTKAGARALAKTERAQRDAMVESIKQRRLQIQFAADGAWPWRAPGNAGARGEFHLPAKRTLSV
jgi:hypothetical protein